MAKVYNEEAMIDVLQMCVLIQIQLARACHKIIIMHKYGLVDIDTGFCTGSSIMPHKRNFDVCELIRGSSAKAIGELTSALSDLKSTPLLKDNTQLYNKMQENIKQTSKTMKTFSKIINTLKLI